MLNEARRQLLDILQKRLQKKKKEAAEQLRLLGSRIGKVDHQIVHALARRKELAEMVIDLKLKTGEPIYRPRIEKQRLASVARWAREEGVSPEFARALQFLTMSESRNVQVAILESKRLGKRMPERFTVPSRKKLRANLLKLTAWWAPRYDTKYGSHSITARLHLEFERTLIKQEITELPYQALLLDIGCATGKETIEHTHGFKRVVGYDVSPEMIAVAQKKALQLNRTQTSFQVHDVEQGLPLEDNSVSFLYMNQGTASDVHSIKYIFEESARVLKPDGKFLFSFYNTDALIYRSFLPWRSDLMAEIDKERQCLDVRCGRKRLSIFAQAYTVDEVLQLLPPALERSGLYTHPTLSAVLPPDVFQEEKVVKLIKHLDKELASSSDHLGAYIVLTGSKP